MIHDILETYRDMHGYIMYHKSYIDIRACIVGMHWKPHRLNVITTQMALVQQVENKFI